MIPALRFPFVFFLHLLDIFFTTLHVVVILFNLGGWIFRKSRKAHLILVSLTFASWFVFGPFCGWGYCFLTDWHWDVKQRLGETALPSSFITYAVNAIGYRSVNPHVVDMVTLFAFVAVVLMTVYVNFVRHSTRVLP